MGHLRKDYQKRVTTAPPPKTTAPIQPNNKKTYAKAVAQPTPVHYPHPIQTDSTESHNKCPPQPRKLSKMVGAPQPTNQKTSKCLTMIMTPRNSSMYSMINSPFLVEGTPEIQT